MIEKLKNGKFRARLYRGRGRIVASSPVFERRQDAVLWESEYKARSLRGELNLAQETVSILEALEEFAKSLVGKTPNYRHELLSTVAQVIDRHGLKVVKDYRGELIEDFKRNIRTSPCTAARRCQHLKRFGKFLYEAGYTKDNPCARVRKPVARNLVERRALQPEELADILRTIEQHAPRLKDFVQFLMLSGCRRMEAVSLEWQDVDLQQRRIRIHDKPHLILEGKPFRCKWGSERVLPISDELFELLSGLPGPRTGFVFPGPSGAPILKQLHSLRAAINKSSVPRPSEITLHSFRHAWVTRLLANGVDLHSVMTYAGHRNIGTTQRYLHTTTTAEKMALDRQRFPGLGIHRASTAPVGEAR